MRGFLSWIISYRRRNEELMAAAVEALQMQAQQIQQWQEHALAATKTAREIAIAARVTHESPELDFRDEWDTLISDLSDSIARMEERIVPR